MDLRRVGYLLRWLTMPADPTQSAHSTHRSLFSLPDLCLQTRHPVRFKPYLYFYEEDSNRHQENKKPLKWLRLWSRHWMLQDDTKRRGEGGILVGFGVRPRARFGRYGGETPAQWREKGVVRLGFGRIEGDSRCHIGSRDTSTCLCILYPPQSILGKNQVCRKVFPKNVKVNWRSG